MSDLIIAPNELIMDDKTEGSTPGGGETDGDNAGFNIGLPVADIAWAAFATIDA